MRSNASVSDKPKYVLVSVHCAERMYFLLHNALRHTFAQNLSKHNTRQTLRCLQYKIDNLFA